MPDPQTAEEWRRRDERNQRIRDALKMLGQGLSPTRAFAPQMQTMEDTYREAARRGIDPYKYDPNAAPRLPDLPSTQDPTPEVPGQMRLPTPPPPPPPPAGILPTPGMIAGMGTGEVERTPYGTAAPPAPPAPPAPLPGDPGEPPWSQFQRGLATPRQGATPLLEGNPLEYIEWLRGEREKNDARAGYERAPEPQGQGYFPPGTPPAQMDPQKALNVMQWRREQEAQGLGPGVPPGLDTDEAGVPEAAPEAVTGAEAVAEEAATEADPAAETRAPGSLPTIERPGDLRRARAMERLGRLSAFRSIAEGLGTPLPVAGEITTGTLPEPFKAEGIRGAMGLEQEGLEDIRAEDKMRLMSQLRGEEQKAGAGFAMERVKAMEKMRIEAARVAREQGEEISIRKGERDQLGREGMAKLNAKLRGTAIRPLTDSSIGRLTAMEHLEKELTGILRDKHKFNTGPVMNAFETTLSYIFGEWAISPEKAGFRSRLNNVLAWYVRAVEGGRPSDKDREFLKTVAPHAGDDDHSLIRKAANLLNWAKRNKVSVERLLKEGRTITGKSSILDEAVSFGDLTSEQQAEGWEPDYVTVQLPGEEPDEILRSRLKGFLRANPDASTVD